MRANAVRGRKFPTIRPAYYRRRTSESRFFQMRKDKHWIITDEFKNSADTNGSGPRLYDYYRIAEYVKQMPTTQEKIDFVNPYEREWNRFERRWWRPYLPAMMKPRQAWLFPPTPKYFDTLNFYKYVTKTHTLFGERSNEEMQRYFLDANEPTDTAIDRLERRLSELLVCRLHSQPDESISDREKNSIFLRHLLEDAYLIAAARDGNSSPELGARLQKHRLSHNPRCESFWIRAGFTKFLERQCVWSGEVERTPNRFTGDDRRRLGELSFAMRDELVVQVRREEKSKALFEWADVKRLKAPIFNEEELPAGGLNKEVIFNPKVYNLWPDPNILWQCPGYDADVDETCKYGLFAVKNVSEFADIIDYWRPDSEQEKKEIRENLYGSTAVSSLFNWLNGQAHCLGHTQYTDIEEPLCSQLILSDGQEFAFALYQLNTIAINIETEGFVNDKTNFCCIDGPFSLYNEYDAQRMTFKHLDESGTMRDGLNRRVLRRFLLTLSQ